MLCYSSKVGNGPTRTLLAHSAFIGLKNLLLLSVRSLSIHPVVSHSYAFQSAWRTVIVADEDLIARLSPATYESAEAALSLLNQTVGEYLLRFGLPYDDAYRDLVSIIRSNGTQTDLSKVDMAQVGFIWNGHILANSTLSLFKVRSNTTLQCWTSDAKVKGYFADGPDAETIFLYNQYVTNNTLLMQVG